MKVLKTVQELLAFREKISEKIGFVPTMGALHAGHLSLIARSKKENSVTACSIFVNPMQFNNPEDFDRYPVTISQDLEFLKREGCDFVFIPSVKEMYPSKPAIGFDFGSLETVMEGAFRPGHFNGVAVVVSKLFHLVHPSVAYFGRKDLQQTLIIKQLVQDLGFPLKIIVTETLREPDGLAMSSRNVRLTAEQRLSSPLIYQALQFLQALIQEGKDIRASVSSTKTQLLSAEEFKLEYLEVVDTATLNSIENSFTGEAAICIAVYLGNVRLIDNVVFVMK